MTEAQRPFTPPSAPRVPPPPPPRPAAPPAQPHLQPPAEATQQIPAQTMPLPPANPAAPGMPQARPVAPPPPNQPPRVPPAPPPGMKGATRSKLAPGQPTLAQIVREAFDKGFSDIHAGVGESPRFRNRGEIDKTDYPVTDQETFFSWLKEILSDEEIQRFQNTLDFDGATQYEFARVRINIFDSLRGPSMVMRLIPLKILTIDQLNLPPVFRDVCHYHKGLILITGPTGSGKSTTMAAMIDYINSEMPKNIITIEDPVEFVHQSKRSLIKQREVGIHTHQFDTALKASLREDPDLILIGEMRDKETVNTALKAAQTGHLVMGTLHTNSAVKTIERILNLYEPDQQAPMRIAIAESLVAVIAQGLCRTTDGKRAAFHDIMINTDAIKDYIRRGEIDEIEAIIPRCTFDGMCSMNQSLYKLYEAGRITEETALEHSPKPNEMAQILRGRV
ncbi:type IV pilus twitching motility protein PilT [Leptolyngbya sp. FACHB-711]|uniref:type IV pilus twitching motility protein PilT n=1 Tax=unclassified Leptolyngbya TaxID=2650499 RepID=UPI001684D97B|nr:type IV pilus twitching motility protein PilT [Leptolyngbya sp. FACHB-711]MBD1851546.1 type IV pilus twitching motility protein PilT [Cyanobacteria bacterium FACHB-502]MBD2025027.1 type IV pilus twitching motility protein PilT [Leptolyngbya sp. FACHB-711]